MLIQDKFRIHCTFLLLLLCGIIFADQNTVSSNIYFDFVREDDGFNAFSMKRAYFTYQKEMSSELSFTFQTDVDFKAEPKNIYLKKAHISWKTLPGKLSIGVIGMNMFNIQEKTWGNRFIEKTAMDRNKYSSSADFGIGFSPRLSESFSINAMVTNGTGYKKSENDTYKKMSIQFMSGEKNLSKNEGINFGGVLSYEPYHKDSATVVSGIFAGIKKKSIRTGLEFTTINKQTSQSLLSGYLNWDVDNSYFIYGRYDVHKIENSSAGYLILGGGYSPVNSLTISPNYRLFSEGKVSESLFVINFQFNF